MAQDLKEELRDQIREGLIQTEQACLQWLEDEERVDAPNQKLEDLWSIPLPLERGELRVREWNRYIQDNRHSVPTHIPIPGPTLSVAGRGGGSNTTHALLIADPETLPIGEVSRPATDEFLETKRLQGQ